MLQQQGRIEATLCHRFNLICAPPSTGPGEDLCPSLGLFKLLSSHKSKETTRSDVEWAVRKAQEPGPASTQINLPLFQRKRRGGGEGERRKV